MSTQPQPEHLAKSLLYALVLLATLGFTQYAIVNWNTQQSWYPFIVGPLMGISMVISLAIIAFAGDYQLGVLATMIFIVFTLASYALTYDKSTILDYEYMIALLGVILMLFVYLDYVEGSVDMKSIHLLMMFAIIYLPYLIYVLLSFKFGYAYDYITMILALVLASANLLLFVPVFTENMVQAIIMVSVVLGVFAIYVISAGVLGPDVTEWMIRSTLLASYLALVWTAVRSGWE